MLPTHNYPAIVCKVLTEFISTALVQAIVTELVSAKFRLSFSFVGQNCVVVVALYTIRKSSFVEGLETFCKSSPDELTFTYIQTLLHRFQEIYSHNWVATHHQEGITKRLSKD